MRPIINKDPRILLPKLLAAAKGQPCFMKIPGVCNLDTTTTVAAHSMQYKDGHCAGSKAHDYKIVFACSACHDFYDGRTPSSMTKQERDEMFNECWERNLKYMFREGLLVAGKNIKAR